MGMTWTKDQQKVIDLRNRNILVSAAAGSGKTAVLVERIIQLISASDNPVNIDELLVVTFTNAAAAQMRERISRAIEEKLEKEPANVHLQKQQTLVHNAQITTIHSFCLYIIRNYFHTIDLDPAFRIADEGELKLLKSDVLEELLEDFYEKGSEEFLNFAESYASGKSDAALTELILQLYEFSMSYPWPLKWLEQIKKPYETSSLEEMEEQDWMKVIKETIQLILEDVYLQMKEAHKICCLQDGPYMYEPAIEQDLKMLQGILEAASYQDLAENFQKTAYARLSSKKDETVSEEKKSLVKRKRDQMKKSIDDLKKQFFSMSPQKVLEITQQSREGVFVLIDLAKEFYRRLTSQKRMKNIVDFNDLEHFALEILVRETEGGVLQSEVAKGLAGHFEEIMIDEYQDSNLVQELLLSSISRVGRGRNNMFMVGDVKQSIYKFRLARPELFMEKYDCYTSEESENQKIDLHQNFRSRPEVLAGINQIFYQIMTKKLGNIVYDETAALHPGADYPSGEQDGMQEYNTELLLIDLDAQAGEEELPLSEDAQYTEKELEAKAIAVKIQELIGAMDVYDKHKKQYRKAEYRDIVILLRTLSGWEDVFAKVLTDMGIPAHTSSKTGYFSALEIRTVLSMLTVLDNPIQDIPLTAVLHSPFAGITIEELAELRAVYPQDTIWHAAKSYAESGVNHSLRDKLQSFFSFFYKLRAMVPYTAIHDMIAAVLKESGYRDYVSAMPAGEQRRANIDMLIEKAVAFERTSYKGLFHFVRYIEHLQKYDVDFGEAGIVGENENTVRIMSIHKSKGLEFPIVFAAGMSKNFNMQDARSKIALDVNLGIGVDYVDVQNRIKMPTLIKKAIQKRTALENLGEELRVLYVAFTRAEEKLIITGTVKKLEKKLAQAAAEASKQDIELGYTKIAGAGSYMDWLIAALIRHPVMKQVLEQYEINIDTDGELVRDFVNRAEYHVSLSDVSKLVNEEVEVQMEKEITKEIMFADIRKNQRQELKEELQERFHAAYPYADRASVRTKLSVSEIKKMSQQEETAEAVLLYEEPEIVPLLPEFMKEEKEVFGTDMGTAYHKILELLDFQKIENSEDLVSCLMDLKADRRAASSLELVNKTKIEKFLTSDLGKRMREAAGKQKLVKEQPFVLGVPAFEVLKQEPSNAGGPEEETVLVQGIIDVYFEEEDGLVVVDYKTDKVRSMKALENRYKIQLHYYAAALEQITGMRVKEKIIYSFALNSYRQIK